MEENRKAKQGIKSFQDLDVYQRLFRLMSSVHKEIIPKIPKEEKYDLIDQLRRSSKASPALLAEGFAKRYQIRQWRKYLDDAIGEINETIHHITVVIALYQEHIDPGLCNRVITEYDYAARQTFKLKEAWKNFHDKS